MKTAIVNNRARIYKDLDGKWNLLYYHVGNRFPSGGFVDSREDGIQKAKRLGISDFFDDMSDTIVKIK